MSGDLLRLLVAAAVVAAVVAVAAVLLRRQDERRGMTDATVEEVVDGDTVRMRGGDVVRLVQIDAPELGDGECWAQAARSVLLELAPPGSRVQLEDDPRVHGYASGGRLDADKVDRFGRILAYLRRGGRNLNVALVRRGAAAPWFFDGVRGRYAQELEDAAREARQGGAGLWGACPHAELDPAAPLETGAAVR